jgi:uncharacterized iron-regulated membrane protein
MGIWYRRVWRWHFYAGIIALPFVLVLAVTGMIYLFKPSLDEWSDRAYDHLVLQGPAHSLDDQVAAAKAALPAARVKAVEWRTDTTDAARVLMVDGNGTPFRVYVRPDDLHVLAAKPEPDRLSEWARKIHGHLLAGEAGAILVETVGAWGIVLFGTGLYLWWPRGGKLAGVLYPRWKGGRLWRDLHAVTGFWISIFALFFLISALPWTKVWGGALKEAQAYFTSTQGDWTTGPNSEHAMHHHEFSEASAGSAIGFDLVAAQAAKLDLAGPVLLMPPSGTQRNWTIKSDSQDRTARRSVEIDPGTGSVMASSGFGDGPLVDRIVGVTTSMHEGHLFGPLNQLFGMVTGLALCLMAISAAAMWLKRKRPGLGAPPPMAEARWAPMAGACVLVVAVLLPTLGVSLAAIIVLEWLILRRIAPVARWLGLAVR